MTTVKVFLQGEQLGPQLTKSSIKIRKKVYSAAKGAAEETLEYVIPRGRDDISNAGKFGNRWTSAFDGRITQGGGYIRTAFMMGGDPPVKYWRVFEHGAVIKGKPMLWIPLSHTGVKVRARDYPGKLFRVDRKGGKAPLLATGNPFTPIYFGKTSVTIPKKFHLTEIIKDGAKQMRKFFKIRMKANG